MPNALVSLLAAVPDALAVYAYDEASGTTAADQTANNHDRTLSGAVALNRPDLIAGATGKSADFAGTGRAANATAAPFDFDRTEAWTYVVVVRLNTLPGGSANFTLTSNLDPGTGFRGIEIGFDNNGANPHPRALYAILSNNYGTNTLRQDFDFVPAAGQKYLIVLRHDGTGTAAGLDLTVNGVPVAKHPPVLNNLTGTTASALPMTAFARPDASNPADVRAEAEAWVARRVTDEEGLEIALAGRSAYVVDKVAGSDANVGGPADPWRTLAPVAACRFGPGDALSLTSRQRHLGPLTYGSGSAGHPDHPVTIAATDADARAVIECVGANDHGAVLTNPQWLTFGAGLRLKGPGVNADGTRTSNGAGVLALSDGVTTGPSFVTGLTVAGAVVEGFNWGIVTIVSGSDVCPLAVGGRPVADGVAGVATGFDRLAITDNEVRSANEIGVHLWAASGSGVAWASRDASHATGRYYRRVDVLRNEVRNVTGNPAIGGGNGIKFDYVSAGRMAFNVVHDCGRFSMPGLVAGPGGQYCYASDNVVIEDGEVRWMRSGGAVDGCAFDADGSSYDVIMRRNFAAQCDGAGLQVGDFRAGASATKRVFIYDNVSIGNGLKHQGNVTIFGLPTATSIHANLISTHGPGSAAAPESLHNADGATGIVVRANDWCAAGTATLPVTTGGGTHYANQYQAASGALTVEPEQADTVRVNGLPANPTPPSAIGEAVRDVALPDTLPVGTFGGMLALVKRSVGSIRGRPPGQ